MFCPKCGKQNEESAAFCSGCGNKLPAPSIISSEPIISNTLSESDKKPEEQKKIEEQKHTAVGCLVIIISIIVIGIYTLLTKSEVNNFKPGSEPDGFGGIKWETDINSIRGMKYLFTDKDGIKVYSKINETPVVEGFIVDLIQYGFVKDKLCMVNVTIRGNEEDFLIFKNRLEEKYGTSLQIKDQFGWQGNKTMIGLKYYYEKGDRFIVYYLISKGCASIFER